MYIFLVCKYSLKDVLISFFLCYFVFNKHFFTFNVIFLGPFKKINASCHPTLGTTVISFHNFGGKIMKFGISFSIELLLKLTKELNVFFLFYAFFAKKKGVQRKCSCIHTLFFRSCSRKHQSFACLTYCGPRGMCDFYILAVKRWIVNKNKT